MHFFKLLVFVLVTALSIGCASHSKLYYDNQVRNLSQQKLGAKIDLNASLGESKDTLRERTIFKYRNLPVYGDSVNGFEGIIYNASNYPVEIVLTGRNGIEHKPIGLDRGDYVYIRLMPDVYNYTAKVVFEHNIYSYSSSYYGSNSNYFKSGVIHVGAPLAICTIKGLEIERHFYLKVY
jgi:hypothetical protein